MVQPKFVPIPLIRKDEASAEYSIVNPQIYAVARDRSTSMVSLNHLIPIPEKDLGQLMREGSRGKKRSSTVESTLSMPRCSQQDKV
jgi:hypothetical protein